MEKRNKMKLIVILVVTIILGIFVANVTAQVLSQNRQQHHNWNSPQNEGIASPSPQGCCKWNNPSCCDGRYYRGCC